MIIVGFLFILMIFSLLAINKPDYDEEESEYFSKNKKKNKK
jgi:hypothetical protein